MRITCAAEFKRVSRRIVMHPEIVKYNDNQEPPHKEICDLLANEIHQHLKGRLERLK
jgi:hypothetical protein